MGIRWDNHGDTLEYRINCRGQKTVHVVRLSIPYFYGHPSYIDSNGYINPYQWIAGHSPRWVYKSENRLWLNSTGLSWFSIIKLQFGGIRYSTFSDNTYIDWFDTNMGILKCS